MNKTQYWEENLVCGYKWQLNYNMSSKAQLTWHKLSMLGVARVVLPKHPTSPIPRSSTTMTTMLGVLLITSVKNNNIDINTSNVMLKLVWKEIILWVGKWEESKKCCYPCFAVKHENTSLSAVELF